MLEPDGYSSSPRRSAYLQRSPLSNRATTSIRKLNECKHFHYEYVELGPVTVELKTVEKSYTTDTGKDLSGIVWAFEIESNGKTWMIHRTFDELSEFDCQLHRCVFDRRYSRLSELGQIFPSDPAIPSTSDVKVAPDLHAEITAYVKRLSQLTGSLITCYPVLKFLELDSRGNHFIPIEQTQINTPAVVSAFVVKDFARTKPDELTLKVGDIISVVEMKHSEQSEKNYWKGKLTVPRSISSPVLNDSIDAHNFSVGYFPSNCVELFGDKPLSVGKETVSSVSSFSQKWHRHRSLLRSFFRSTAKINSASEDAKVFGVDLTEYLEKSQLDVPLVLNKCSEVIETHGVVTGIYRQCGIQSNIRQLRWEFDSGIVPNFSNPTILQDIHCVSSLLKQYFRQLPNPLFTYELYLDILEAFGSRPIDKISNVRAVVKRLPPAYYRTAKALMHHLNRMSKKKDLTDMTASNLAIVWAPNLFRNPPELDTSATILSGINVHKNLCNFLIVHAYSIFEEVPETFDTSLTRMFFNSKIENLVPDIDASSDDNKDDSLSKLDNQKENHIPVDRSCIDVNGGPATLPKAFHTVLQRRSITENSIDVPNIKMRKKMWRNSTMESSLVGFLNRRGIVFNNTFVDKEEEEAHHKRKWSNISDPTPKLQRSESIFAHLDRNIRAFKDRIVKTARDRARSVRRSSSKLASKSRKNSCLETASVIERVDSLKLANARYDRFSTMDFPVSSRLMSQSMEPEMFHVPQTPPPHPKLPPHAKMDENSVPQTPCSVRSLKQESRKTSVTPSPMMRRRHVMFEQNSPPKEVIYEVENSSSKGSKERELSTDASSAESLPLDVSRYDNVSPQNDNDGQVSSTPLSFYEDPHLVVQKTTTDANSNNVEIYYF